MNELVATLIATRRRHAATSQANQLAVLAAGRDFDFDATVERLDTDLSTKCGVDHVDFGARDDVRALSFKAAIRPHTDMDVEIAALTV